MPSGVVFSWWVLNSSRTTIITPGVTLGASVATQRTVDIQKGLVPGLRVDSYQCLEFDGSPSADDPCTSGDLVKVTVSATYSPVALLGLGGPIQLTATSSLQVP